MSRSAPRYCRSCGALAPDSGRFCPSCGSSLSLTTPYPAPDGVRHDREPRDGAHAREPIPYGSATPASQPVVTPTLGGSVRMGFGIALGMLLFSMVVVALVGLMIGVSAGLITWPFGESAQKFEGRGPANSAPIQLDGPVTIEWTASPSSPVGCQFGASLLAQNDAGFSIQLASTMIDQAQSSGIPRALALAPRPDYFLRVEPDCSWAIRVIRK